MILAYVLLALFALLAAAGAGAIGNHFRGRSAGVLAAALTLAFFAALYAAVFVFVFRRFEAP